MIPSQWNHGAVVMSMDEEFKHAEQEITRAEELYKDPVKLGYLIHRLVEEREISNRLFKEILAHLDIIEKGLGKVETGGGDQTLLSELEEKILHFVGEKGRVDADDLREAFAYSNQNGASARLNRLYELGYLEKGRAGRKVLYWKKK
jgi:hypothetical protein